MKIRLSAARSADPGRVEHLAGMHPSLARIVRAQYRLLRRRGVERIAAHHVVAALGVVFAATGYSNGWDAAKNAFLDVARST